MYWPGAKDADLWMLIWEELHGVHQERILVDVEHVKARRSKKEMQQMSLLEKFTTEGKVKADELGKEGAMLDGGAVAQVRAITVQQERQEVYAALPYAASFHCLVEERKDCEELGPKPKEMWIFVDKKSEETRHRTEWCAAANKNRCMRCGRSRKHMNMQGHVRGPRCLREDSRHKLNMCGMQHLGGHDMVRRVNRNGEALMWCKKCSVCVRHQLGPTLMNRCKLENVDTKEYGRMEN